MTERPNIIRLDNLRGLDFAGLGLRWSSRKLIAVDGRGGGEAWHMTLSGGTPYGANVSGTLDIHLTMEGSAEHIGLAKIPFYVLEELGKEFAQRLELWVKELATGEMRPVSAAGLAAGSWRLALFGPEDFDRALSAVARKRKKRLAIDADAMEKLDQIPEAAMATWFQQRLHHPRCLSDLTPDEKRGPVVAMRPGEDGGEMMMLIWAPNASGVYHWWSFPLATDMSAVFEDSLFSPAFEALSPYLGEGLGRLLAFLETRAGFEPDAGLRALPAAMMAGTSYADVRHLLQGPDDEDEQWEGAEEGSSGERPLLRLWASPPRMNISRPGAPGESA